MATLGNMLSTVEWIVRAGIWEYAQIPAVAAVAVCMGIYLRGGLVGRQSFSMFLPDDWHCPFEPRFQAVEVLLGALRMVAGE